MSDTDRLNSPRARDLLIKPVEPAQNPQKLNKKSQNFSFEDSKSEVLPSCKAVDDLIDDIEKERKANEDLRAIIEALQAKISPFEPKRKSKFKSGLETQMVVLEMEASRLALAENSRDFFQRQEENIEKMKKEIKENRIRTEELQKEEAEALKGKFSAEEKAMKVEEACEREIQHCRNQKSEVLKLTSVENDRIDSLKVEISKGKIEEEGLKAELREKEKSLQNEYEAKERIEEEAKETQNLFEISSSSNQKLTEKLEEVSKKMNEAKEKEKRMVSEIQQVQAKLKEAISLNKIEAEKDSPELNAAIDKNERLTEELQNSEDLLQQLEEDNKYLSSLEPKAPLDFFSQPEVRKYLKFLDGLILEKEEAWAKVMKGEKDFDRLRGQKESLSGTERSFMNSTKDH